ncbi:MAG: hypothetical protein KKE20_05185, partial [Nanoarchaeota archaeon]|nr:hypothetical protein [Nanoarchaeota archaeon]
MGSPASASFIEKIPLLGAIPRKSRAKREHDQFSQKMDETESTISDVSSITEEKLMKEYELLRQLEKEYENSVSKATKEYFGRPLTWKINNLKSQFSDKVKNHAKYLVDGL